MKSGYPEFMMCLLTKTSTKHHMMYDVRYTYVQCIYARMHVFTYSRIYVCTYVRVFVCTYVRMYVCTYVRMYVCTMCIRAYICALHICMYARTYICTYARMYLCTLYAFTMYCVHCTLYNIYILRCIYCI